MARVSSLCAIERQADMDELVYLDQTDQDCIGTNLYPHYAGSQDTHGVSKSVRLLVFFGVVSRDS